jgi:hypothetical protein
MHVEKTERSIGELISQIAGAEIKLPELQREYVWKPTQVAKLVDSLYRGYPSGSLLFWEADEDPVVRPIAAAGPTSAPSRAPLYLLDGQQRLTSLYRVVTNHPDAQVVFNVERERFQNESAATRTDPRWIKVSDVLDPATSMLRQTKRLIDAGSPLEDTVIEQRLGRVRQLRERRFHMEILKGFPYEEVAEIFVRVNSAGRRLGTLDLAMATLSARWPGVLGKLQAEAEVWRGQQYDDIDVSFLSRVFAAVVLGSGLSAWSHGRLANASDEQLEQSWATVRRGLARLVPLLKGTLGLTRSAVLPNPVVLIPLVILLGERPDERLDEQTGNAVIYWLLVATIRSRYGSSTDTRLSQDIRAARRPDPIRALFGELDLYLIRPRVTADSLVDRPKEGPYLFLSLLALHARGARDWWLGTDLLTSAGGGRKLSHHEIHPASTVDEKYRKAAANDLANLVFVSPKAGRMIGTKSPKDYFGELSDEELTAHLVPLDESLREPSAFPDFLAERRRLLARAMTELLDRFRPTWLERMPMKDEGVPDGRGLSLTLYASTWDRGRLEFTATIDGSVWTASANMADLERAISAAVETGFDSDIEIGGESVPVVVTDDTIQVNVGPFVVTGTNAEWMAVFERERADTRPLNAAPKPTPAVWTEERTPFSISETR